MNILYGLHRKQYYHDGVRHLVRGLRRKNERLMAGLGCLGWIGWAGWLDWLGWLVELAGLSWLAGWLVGLLAG